VASLRDSDGSFTQAGSVLGTPAFMPPEQAAGLVGKIDARSDVFGLGGILAVILTGQAPFAAASAETTRLKAVQGDVADCLARLDACGAEPELVALCKRCLRPKPADRPADAEEVARAVAHLRSAAERRARQAELDHAKAEVQAAEQARRRRTLAVAGGSLVVVLVAGVVASSLLAWRSYQEKTRAEKAEQLATEEKVKAQDAEKVALEQSLVAIDALGNMVHEVQNELEDVPGGFAVRQQILNRAVSLLTKLNDTPDTSDRVIRRHILAHMQLGDFAWARGDRGTAHKEYLISLDHAERAVQINPHSDKAKGNLMALMVKVGESEQYYLGKLKDALRRYEIAAEGWAELTQKMRPIPAGDIALPEVERLDLPECERALADCYDRIAKIYYADEDSAKRDPVKAEKYLTDSLAITKRVVASDANRNNRMRLCVSYMNLADLALRCNDIERLVSNNQELMKIRQSVLKEFPWSLKAKREMADSDLRLGDAFFYAKQPDRAYPFYRDALKWSEQVMWSEPSSKYYQGRVCQSHYCVGCSALRAGDRNTAEHHFREALKIREEHYQELKAKNQVDRYTLGTLMLTVVRCGDHRRAADLAEQVRPLADARVLAEEVGTTYGLCMAVVQGDRKLEQLTPEERKLRDRYHDLALAAIKEGTAMGYNVVLFLEGDPDMEPLLALPEYQAWLADFKRQLSRKSSQRKE
jgi:tetratricopeptide (TPR) repeat protein